MTENNINKSNDDHTSPKPLGGENDSWSLLNERRKKLRNGSEGKESERGQSNPHVPDIQQKMKCPHCAKENEKNREFCWACFSPLYRPVDQNNAGVVIRKSYLFTPDEAAPPSAGRGKGATRAADDVEIDYSGMVEYSDRIKTRTGEEVIKIPARDIRIFKGTHLIAVRIDGRNYTSEDTNIPMEAKMIIRRVQSGESIHKILADIRTDSSAAHHTSPTHAGGAKKRVSEMDMLAENLSMIIIVSLSIVFVILFLAVLKDWR